MNQSSHHIILSQMFRKLVCFLAAIIALGAFNARAVGTGTLSLPSGWYPLGTNLAVYAIPGPNSVFTGWLGNTNGATVSGTNITFAVNSSLSVTGLFSTAQYTLTVASAYGTPTPPGITTNVYNSLINAYAQTPVVNGTTQYVATGWTGTGSVGSGTGTNVSFNITNNSTLTWLWRTNYLLTATAGANGSITPNGSTYVARGANQSYTITPNANYSVTSVTVDGTNAGTPASYTFTNVTTTHTLQVAFGLNQFTLTVASAYGTPTPGGTTTNVYNTLINAYIPSPVTNANGTTQYVATGWTGTGSVGSGTSTNVSFNITNNSTLTWLWQTNVWVNLNVLGN